MTVFCISTFEIFKHIFIKITLLYYLLILVCTLRRAFFIILFLVYVSYSIANEVTNMREKDDARNRIRRRRGLGESYYLDSQRTNNFNWLYAILMVVFLFTAITFLVGKEKMITYIRYGSHYIQQIVPWNKIIPFENLNLDNTTSPVNAKSIYSKTNEIGQYTNDSNAAVSLGDGLVVYIGENKNATFIVISHDNGVSVTYGNLDYANVSLYDRVLKGNQIGVFNNTILLEAMKDNTDIDMEEAMELFED